MHALACLAVHQANGRYGWAAVVKIDDEELLLTGQQRGGSRSYLTLLAMTKVLRVVRERSVQSCRLYVPSPIWVDKFSRLKKWRDNRWRGGNRSKLKDTHLWSRVYAVARKVTIEMAILRNCAPEHKPTVQLARRLARHNPIFAGGSR